VSLRASSVSEEGVYQASKFLKIQVLCDAEELRALFDALKPFWIYPLSGIGSGEEISSETFLAKYATWIEQLKNGAVPKEVMAWAFAEDPSCLWKQEVPGKGYLVKIAKPVVQVQGHYFTYSRVDGEFRPMTMGQGSVFWGLQFMTPQIYQDPKTMELREVGENRIFKIIRQWSRDFTRPTPFVVDGKKSNEPIRLGKNCFSWINNHPQLIENGITVHAT
jgi:hypothetical protein